MPKSFYKNSLTKNSAKILSTLCSISLLSACADPIIAKDVVSDDYKLSCQQLAQEIGASEFALTHARKDDRFRLGYILIIPAAVSYMRMSEAEEAAQKRVDGLTDIAQRKQCDLSAAAATDSNASAEKKDPTNNAAAAPIQQAPTAPIMRQVQQQPGYAPQQQQQNFQSYAPAQQRAPMAYNPGYQPAAPYQQQPYAAPYPAQQAYPQQPAAQYPQAVYPPMNPGNPVQPPMR